VIALACWRSVTDYLAQRSAAPELRPISSAGHRFGAFLDVAVDCFSRTCVWVWAVGPAAAVPITLELLTFVCTHKARLLALESSRALPPTREAV